MKTLLDAGDNYGIDADRIVIAGSSAGGTLAAAVALHLRNENKTLAGQVKLDIINFKNRENDIPGTGILSCICVLDICTLKWLSVCLPISCSSTLYHVNLPLSGFHLIYLSTVKDHTRRLELATKAKFYLPWMPEAFLACSNMDIPAKCCS